MKGINWQIKINRDGGPLADTSVRDDVDVEKPVNRRERRAVAAWKRKQAKKDKKS